MEAIRVILDNIETLEQRVYRVEDTCNRLEVWKEEELRALRSSREHLRVDWLNAGNESAENPAG